MVPERFRCCLAGDNSLTIACGEILLDRGYEILCVVTEHYDMKCWCKENHIKVYAQDQINHLKQYSFEYLFSIAYLNLIPEEIISSAGKYAINYHDALLPTYAGIHATSWALMNGEMFHGTTWHLMEKTPDTGDILIQKQFAVSESDTAFSLNLHCFQTAIEGFEELLDDIISSRLSIRKQALDKRSYYGKWKKPDQAGVINWNKSTAEVVRFVNSLDFGESDNTLATAKIVLDGKLYIVERLTARDGILEGEPGTLTWEGNCLVVKTSEGSVELLSLRDIDGNAVECLQVFNKERTSANLQVEETTGKQLENKLAAVSKHESYWVEKLYDASIVAADSCIDTVTGDRELNNPGETLLEELLFTLKCKLEQVVSTDRYYIGYGYGQGEPFISEIVPFYMALNSDNTDAQAIASLRQEWNDVQKNGSYCRDLYYRYQKLNMKRFQPKIVIYAGEPTKQTVSQADICFFVCEKEKTVGYRCNNHEQEQLLAEIMKESDHWVHGRMSTGAVQMTEHFSSVYQLVCKQAETFKAQTAVISGNVQIAYEDLIDKIDQRAAVLYHKGVRKGMNVGVLHRRNQENIISFLAAMKLGAPYIPMDTFYPAQRLIDMAVDGEIQFLITESDLPSIFKEQNLTVIEVDRERYDGLHKLEAVMLEPKDPVYILYTSGSTGKPKGVVVNHLGLSNLLLSMQKEPGFTNQDKLLSITTVCFDISALELYLPLISGGIVEIVSDTVVHDGILLKNLLETTDATVIQATPSMWHMLLAAEWEKRLDLKILCGGENLNPELADHLLKRCNELWNMYGPTETTIWSTIKHITDKNDVTIGKPISNTTVYILGKKQTEVGTQQAGELCIGGLGVANGYYKNEALSAERFMDNPVNPGELIYRTGDLVKKNYNGDLIYLGRMDNQVKYHGFRIELEEIERVVQKQLKLNQVVVVLRKDPAGEDALYAIVESEVEVDAEKAAAVLGHFLPEYMIPSQFITLHKIPLTGNQKANRKLLAAMSIDDLKHQFTPKQNDSCQTPSPASIKNQQNSAAVFLRELQKIAADVIKRDINDLDPDRLLNSYGFNSIRYTVLATKINKAFDVAITPVICYIYKTLREMANYLLTIKPGSAVAPEEELLPSFLPERILPESSGKEQLERNDTADIAVIGIGMHLPQANSMAELWQILEHGECVVGEVPPDRWELSRYRQYDKKYPAYGAFMDDIWSFDPDFFQLTPREAKQLDPQQRLFLQTAWETFEDAGYNPETISDKNIAVYVGVVESDYYNRLSRNIDNADIFTISGNIQCAIANRVSYMFDFNGESETVNTACSSSLVAIHHAMKALNNNECSLAVAGGVNVILNPFMHYALHQNGMLSPDGKCKSFDSEANGYVRGEGCCALLLKPLHAAQADGDFIYGVLKGSAVNHDGKTNSFTAPNPVMQANVIKDAYERAGVRPEYVSYIETHGTGTKLGDPIEVSALKKGFQDLAVSCKSPVKQNYCALGAVKANIGHLEGAAGIAGVIKVLLCMQKKTIPQIAGIKELNPYLEIDQSPFYIPTKNQPWKGIRDAQGNHRLIAGVSSFGFGGTNAHVILESYEQTNAEKRGESKTELFVLSASDEQGLKRYANVLLDYLRSTPPVPELNSLEKIAYTLQTGRKACRCRAAFLADNLNSLKQQLDAFAAGRFEGDIMEGKGDNAVFASLFDDSEGNEYIAELIRHNRLDKLGRLWVLGADIPWAAVLPKRSRAAGLPTYPFSKECYRFDAIDQYLDGSELTGEHCIRLNPDDDVLKEHLINGHNIVPGIKYLEMAVRTFIADSQTQFCLEDNEWLAAKTIAAKEEQLYIDKRQTEDGIEYKIYQKCKPHDVVYAKGRVVLNDVPAVPCADMPDAAHLKNSLPVQLGVGSIYQLFEEMGYHYGSLFRPLEQVYCSQDEALSIIHITDEMKEKTKQDRLNISLLEGGMQTVIGCLHQSGFKQNFMPVRISRCEIHTLDIPEYAYGYAKLTDSSETEDKIIRTFDIMIFDVSGNLLISIFGYVLNAFKQRIKNGQNLLVEKQLCLAKLTDVNDEKLNNAVIYTINGTGFGSRCLLEHLAKKSRIIPVNETKLTEQQAAEADYILVFGNTHDNNPVLVYQHMAELAHKLLNGIFKGRLIYLFEEKTDFICYEQAMEGLARCYKNETVSSIMKVIQADDFAVNQVAVIRDIAANNDAYVLFKNKERYTFRFAQAEALNQGKLLKDPYGTYLITGGTGVIGRQLAANLCSSYPNVQVVLLSRNAESKDQKDQRIHLVRADITDENQTKEAVKMIETQYGTIKGVFHAAGTIEDCYLRNQTDFSSDNVIEAKIRGALNLDHVLMQHQLDFFILFSSLSAVLGNAGQSAYCYANSFLDYFAGYRNTLVARKERKGNTLSVNWGIWNDGGMKLSDVELKSLKVRTGISPLSSEQAFRVLFDTDMIERTNLCVVDAVMDQLLPHLNGNGERVADAAYCGKDSGCQNEQLLELLADCCCKVTGISRSKISADKKFSEYGLDSLMNTELADVINGKLGLDLTPVTFFEYTTLSSLAEYLKETYEQLRNVTLPADTAENKQPSTASEAEHCCQHSFQLLPQIPYIAGHTVYAQPVVLGMTYISHFYQSLMKMNIGFEQGSFKNIVFHEPIVADTVEPLSFSVSCEDKSNGVVFQESCIKNGTETVTATGTFTSKKTDRKLPNDWELLITQADRVVDGVHVYQHKWNYDVKYSKEMQSVDRIYLNEQIAVGQIKLNPDLAKLPYEVNPAILDGAMICGLYAFLEDVKDSYIPYMIKSVDINVSLPETCYCICKKTMQNEEFIYMDIMLVDRFGNLFAEMNDFICKKITLQSQFIRNRQPDVKEEIAIIGISASFAGSETPEELWENLLGQKDLISEIPKNHFEYQEYYDPDSAGNDKMYTKWGGFLPNVDQFDAAFFQISRREAQVMDPQLRLLLQHLYHTAEDAGYAGMIKGSKTGMYVGCCFHDYQQKMDRMQMPVSPHDATGNAFTMLANRPSYYFDLKGPSINVDTACSSSLVALHLACNALRQNECDMAFAAGVNLLLDSWHYRYFCSIGALSKSGRCHTFSDQADGYIPGEGVAAVLLKPLGKAVADGDQIYGVIKGSAINHGGLTSSVTVPSVKQEAQVIMDAWQDAQVDAGDISYIEAHGTGTKLGDPIEIKAIVQAMEQCKKSRQNCYLGSAKAYFGHTEGAAGLAGLVKVILSMQHGIIPAIPSFGQLNPYINLTGTNLNINREAINWKPLSNRKIAGVSSFGAGGAYAHVVVAEHVAEAPRPAFKCPRLIVLSAKTVECLRQKCKDLQCWIGRQQSSDEDTVLRNMSYTLMTGREQMSCRLAFIAVDLLTVQERLSQYLQGDFHDVYVNEINEDESSGYQFIAPELSPEEAARLWVENSTLPGRQAGYHIDPCCPPGFGKEKAERISLPCYPFEKNSYWIEERKENGRQDLVWEHDFFIKNHRINQVTVMPAVAYLEYVIRAYEGSRLTEGLRFTNLNFIVPMTNISNSRKVTVEFGEDGSQFKVRSIDKTEQPIHVQGFLTALSKADAQFCSTEEFENLTNQLTADQFYEQLNQYGLTIGSEFRTVNSLSYSNNKIKAHLVLDKALKNTFHSYLLHPAVMDGALQAAISRDNDDMLHIPFEVQTIDYMRGLTEDVIVYGQRDGRLGTWNLTITDAEHRVLVRILGLLSQRIKPDDEHKADSDKLQILKNLSCGIVTTDDAEAQLEELEGW